MDLPRDCLGCKGCAIYIHRHTYIHIGREGLWAVYRINIRQVRMEKGYQVRMYVRNLLVTEENQRRRLFSEQ